MKILRVSDSMDFWPEVPVDQRTPAILERRLAAETGEETEIVVRGPRLRPESDKMLDEWLDEIQPDICMVHLNPFWYAYESPAVQLGRSRGPLRAAGRIARRASHNRVVRRTPAYGLARRFAQKTVGGSYLLEPQQAIRVYEYWLRAILRREVIVPGIIGPRSVVLHETDPGRWARMEKRRIEVNRGLASLCEQLQVINDLPIERPTAETGKQWVGEDGMHPRAVYHRQLAEYLMESYLEAWRELRNKRAPAGMGSP